MNKYFSINWGGFTTTLLKREISVLFRKKHPSNDGLKNKFFNK